MALRSLFYAFPLFIFFFRPFPVFLLILSVVHRVRRGGVPPNERVLSDRGQTSKSNCGRRERVTGRKLVERMRALVLGDGSSFSTTSRRARGRVNISGPTDSDSKVVHL